MDEPRAMGVVQRVGDLARDPQRLVQRQLPLAVQPIPQRLPSTYGMT